ncbi:MAG: PH domain-containing protein [Clostridia bacterium]|nr:PH domain-containing protein [Clostridia bacterium]
MVIREEEFRNLAPEARKCMFTTALALVAFFLLAAALTWIILRLQGLVLPLWGDLLFLSWALLWLIYLFVAPAIRYRRYRYLIDKEKVVVREGLLFITMKFAPIERLHQITVKSGPIDRLYGLARVIATTAGGIVAISFLPRQEAEEIADMLQAKVRYILKQQGVSLSGLDETNAAGATKAACAGDDDD